MSSTGMIAANAIPLLHVEGICKSFPGVRALTDIDFQLFPGTVHVLCGENGAGKSTFVKILNGIHQPDRGEIRVNGEVVTIHNPSDARRIGIGMIFQELDYVPDFTVEQSLFLGVEPRNAIGGIDRRQIRRRTIELLETEGLPYEPTAKLRDLTISDIQILEIQRALSADRKILLMDEPTSAISDKEVDLLFDTIGRLRSRGVGILYISHKIDEILEIADEITVFRDGVRVAHNPAGEIDKDDVISSMVGRSLKTIYPEKPSITPGAVGLKIEKLTRTGSFEDVSLTVRRGEVVGLAGLVGAGRTEVARSAFGLDPFDGGEVTVHGTRVASGNVALSIKRGLAMVSEDRKRYGLLLGRNVKENATLLVLDRFFRGGWNRRRIEEGAVRSMFATLGVKTSSLSTIAGTLSGSNQQKVMLARWLLKDQRVIMLDEPTRGIDVGAKYEIYRIIHALAQEGKAILVISSELPELIGICDRMYVMAKGRIVGELSRREFDQRTIMRYATQTRG